MPRFQFRDSKGYPDPETWFPDKLPRVESTPPLYAFKTVEEFVLSHREGTEAEFNYEDWQVGKFNQDRYPYKAWPLTAGLATEPSEWMLLVAPGPNDAMLPKENETCNATVFQTKNDASDPEKTITKRGSSASRVDNPCAGWGITDPFWQRCMAFKISLDCNDSTAKPSALTLASANSSNRSGDFLVCEPENAHSKPSKRATLTPARSAKSCTNGKGFDATPEHDKPQVWVVFELRMSLSTRRAEIGALNKFVGDPEHDIRATAGEKQLAAFEYFVLLEHKKTSSLFDVFPHMADPVRRPTQVHLKLMDRFCKFNDQQNRAYWRLLGELKDGICMVPGGPGAGKTFWNLTVAAMLQHNNEIKMPADDSPSESYNKVLYLLDMNRPLTDVANKMVQLYEDLDFKRHCCDDCGAIRIRSVIRMFCWSYEQAVPSRGHITAQRQELDNRRARRAQNQPPIDRENGPLAKFRKLKRGEDSTDLVPLQGFAAGFFRSINKAKDPRDQQPTGQDCFAKTLDEAATEFYKQHCDTTYPDIKQFLSDEVPTQDLQALRDDMVEQLYRDTLANADFVATTPVTASKFANALFAPSIVIFDEAPHARDLSLLISVASFNPHAWILTGDHRQSRPFVKSEGHNEYCEQMRVSFMERAYLKNPQMPALLINHRARGDLHQLASQLFYNSEMTAAVDPHQPGATPKETLYLRDNCIMPLGRGIYDGIVVRPVWSRLLVVLDNVGSAKQEQNSWYHPGHQEWVMRLIRKLTRDYDFKQVNSEGKGTILVIAPYKLASTKYGRAIKGVNKNNLSQGLGGCTVEARTTETAQGYEADVCIVDYVRSGNCTTHMEDAHRMNVAHTRSRQMEIVVMSIGMVTSVEKSPTRFPNMAKMIAYCKQNEQYVKFPRPENLERRWELWKPPPTLQPQPQPQTQQGCDDILGCDGKDAIWGSNGAFWTHERRVGDRLDRNLLEM